MPKVYDCAPFFNELDILDIRLAELDPVVDWFIIAEAPVTFSGKPKPLYFQDNRDRYAKYAHKIRHLIIEDMPGGNDAWVRDVFQRNAVMRGLTDAAPDDVVLCCDCDEIPRAEVVRDYRPEHGVRRLQLLMHYYALNQRSPHPWDKARIGPYSAFVASAPDAVRMNPAYPTIVNAGWHFSYCGGPERIAYKIDSFAHQEFNNDHFKNPERIARAVANGEDLYGRSGIGGYAKMPVDSSFPAYVRANVEHLTAMGLIRPV